MTETLLFSPMTIRGVTLKNRIVVGREILNNPNWPMDAALKLGVEGPFRNVPPQFGYWLGTRAKRGFGTRPSTWQNGLQEAD
jgi:hypothetical protein